MGGVAEKYLLSVGCFWQRTGTEKNKNHFPPIKLATTPRKQKGHNGHTPSALHSSFLRQKVKHTEWQQRAFEALDIT